MNTSTFRTNLKTILNGNSTFVSLGVDVHKYPPGKQALMRPTVFIGSISVDKEDLTLLATQRASYTVNGGGYMPAAGAGEAEWAAAESTANTLLNGLETELVADQTVGGSCIKARVSSWTLTPSNTPEGNVFMDFDYVLSVTAIE